MNTTELSKAALHCEQLRYLCAFYLRVLDAHVRKQERFQIRLSFHSNQQLPGATVSSYYILDAVEKQIQEAVTNLLAAGIDVEQEMRQFSAAAEAILQQTKNPLDIPAGL